MRPLTLAVGALGCFAVMVTGAATPATEQRHVYSVHPLSDATDAEIEALGHRLRSLSGAHAHEIIAYNADAGADRVFAWSAELTETEASGLKGEPGVDFVLLDVGPGPDDAVEDSSEPAPADVFADPPANQKRVPIVDVTKLYELEQIGLRPGSVPGPDPEDRDYIHDDTSGEGITVYVIDTAFSLDHRDFSNRNERSIRILPVRDPHRRKKDTLRSSEGHGDCCASKAVGIKSGAAPLADLVAVAMDNTFYTTHLSAMAAITRDIQQFKLHGKAVVTSSIGVVVKMLQEHKDIMFEFMYNILARDVPIVVPSGNDALITSPDITDFPATLAANLPIIVVGAVNETGDRTEWSQGGPLLTTAVGGQKIICAGTASPTEALYRSGTSYAAPLVAGMIAEWLSMDGFVTNFEPGGLAERIKTMVTDLHWARKEGGWKVAWNGVDPRGDTSDTSDTSNSSN